MKAHRTKKEKEKMTKIERFVTEGNEKADELAVRAVTERRSVRSLAICSQLPLFGGGLERL